MFRATCLLFSVILGQSCTSGYSTAVNNTRLCFSDMENISGYPKNGSFHVIERLFGDSCTHIIGNLILTDLHAEDNGLDPDLSFLESIQEVTGYVIIMYSSVAKIPLSNLRVIRAENGGYQIHPNLDRAALVIRKNYNHHLALMKIDLRGLKSIVRGSVYIYDNPGLCGWSDRINWSELFETPGEQRVIGKRAVEVETHSRGAELMDDPVHSHHQKNETDLCVDQTCSGKCNAFSDGKVYCWGPSVEECQTESRCNRLLCNRCYTRSEGQYCCHDQCLGGCFGPDSDECEVCKEFNNSGICVPHCGLDSLSGGLAAETDTRLETKYRLGNLCVSVCPHGFLLENGACVTHCTTSDMHAVGHACRPCGEQCPKSCEIIYPISSTGHQIARLGGHQLQKLTNCTHLKGDLVITDASFLASSSIPNHVPIRTVGELFALHSLREVSGYVYLDLGYLGKDLQNFTFLENLVKVSGYHPAIKCSVMIINSGAQYPGLRSLRHVPRGSVIFMNNSRLCYVNTLPWVRQMETNDYNILHLKDSVNLSRISGEVTVISSGNSEVELCESAGAVCHHSCDPNYGCWGPEPEHCIRCLVNRAGRKCVSLCEYQPGFMSRPILTPTNRQMNHSKELDDGSQIAEQFILPTGLPDSDYYCLPCHPECRQTCSGPGAHECIGGCKTAWAEGRCVSNCNPHTYFNEDKRICEACHTHCHQRSLTLQAVCSGPGRHFGSGGCNKCEKLLISGATEEGLVTNFSSSRLHKKSVPPWICVRGDCPPTTYLTTELIKPDSEFAQVAETFTNLLPVCRPCHPLCLRCTAFSVLEANVHRQGCVECSGFWFREKCVESCPDRDTYEIPSNQTLLAQQWSISYLQLPNQNLTKLQDMFVRHVSQRCLACNPECHMGCWGPQPSQCYHCHNVRVQLSLVPTAILQNNIPLYNSLKAVRVTEVNRTKIPLPELVGPSICLPGCPQGLDFLIDDPFNGDRLCHFAKMLSVSETKQIMHENSLYPHPFHPLLRNEKDPSRTTRTRGMLLTALILCTVAIFITVCCCFHRIRGAQLKKSGYSTLSTLSFPFGSWRSWTKRHQTEHSKSTMSRGLDEMGLLGLAGDHDTFRMGHAGPLTSSNDSSLTWRTVKAPNLGRLVMIQSDDLILDERSGPLGTGAFGAVYRGVWRVPTHDNTSTQSASSLCPNGSANDTSQSALTISTTLPSQSLDYEETNGTESSSNQPFSQRPQSEQDRVCLQESSVKVRPRHRMIQVAVKILNEVRGASDLDALLDEAKVMASVSHRNCLPLLGVCLSQCRKCLVSAYVTNGSLERYLRTHGRELSPALLIKWCEQIADGMTYLQSRGIIHRDLATRNVLVTSKEHLQITDFGLAKMLEGEDEENSGELVVRSGRVPIRWLAIETLTHGRYSFKTDVWSYGVTIWEVFSFGKKPYEHIETGHVKAHILSGNRLPQPDICSNELYQIMMACWAEDPHKRPTFANLLGRFQELSLNPDSYVFSREANSTTTSTMNIEECDESQSRRMSYPGFLASNDQQLQSLTPNTSELVSITRQEIEDNAVISRSGALSPSRRFDPRRRKRCSLVIPPTSNLQIGRFVKYQQQKRRSTGCRPDTGTLSTSLSMTSSGLSDRWSHSAFPHHSHPVLAEVQESNATTSDAKVETGTSHRQDNHHCQVAARLNQQGLKTDSWASSGQPLLSSDHDSSFSHLMLSNLGYTSSSSHVSMQNPPGEQSVGPIHGEILSEDHATSNPMVGRLPNTGTALSNVIPSNFVMEAAAGYVWPQWPSVISEDQPVDSLPLEINESSSAGDEELNHLNRQLWIRRNARQRQYYLRQSQIQRSDLRLVLPENVNEETRNVNETSGLNSRHVLPAGLSVVNDSETEDATERYCPDPTDGSVCPTGEAY